MLLFNAFWHNGVCVRTLILFVWFWLRQINALHMAQINRAPPWIHPQAAQNWIEPHPNTRNEKLNPGALMEPIRYVPMSKLKLYICKENIDFFWRFEICRWKYRWTFLKIFNDIFFSLYFWYDVDKTRQQQNQILVILRSYNHLHQP